MSTTNHVGNLGEAVVSLLFGRKTGGRYRFGVQFLGAKAQLLDFLIELLDEGGAPFGPYFFVQVKCTEDGDVGGSAPAVFTAAEVSNAQKKLVPVYLAAVRIVDEDSEEVFILAVDSSLEKGIAVVPNFFPLTDNSVRLKIYDEVKHHFDNNPINFVSELTRKARKIGGEN